MSFARRIAFATVGCKLNQYETAALQTAFEAAGFQRVAFDQVADVYVVNSCAVTHRSEADSRKLARRAARLNPEALVVLAGCYAQLQPAQASAVEGVGLVVGTDARAHLVNLVEEALAGVLPRQALTDFQPGAVVSGPASAPRRRAYLKAQDGCDFDCAYCAITLARGPSRSRQVEDILREAEILLERGAVELILTGVNVGDWGKGYSPRRTLAWLARKVLALGEGFRVRFSSLEPQFLSGELFELLGFEPRIAPHLHMPLQSGSERLLERMRRPHTVAQFIKFCSIAKFNDPAVGLGTDLITGLPGETDEDFEATLNLVEALPLTYGHVFSYSERPGTLAATWPDDVPPEVKKARARALREALAAKQAQFLQRMIGRRLEVVAEEEISSGLWQGTSGNYLTVRFEASSPPALAEVEITEARQDWLVGTLE